MHQRRQVLIMVLDTLCTSDIINPARPSLRMTLALLKSPELLR